jgi:hypothetical protein
MDRAFIGPLYRRGAEGKQQTSLRQWGEGSGLHRTLQRCRTEVPASVPQRTHLPALPTFLPTLVCYTDQTPPIKLCIPLSVLFIVHCLPHCPQHQLQEAKTFAYLVHCCFPLVLELHLVISDAR